jgi:thioredoxin-related protein
MKSILLSTVYVLLFICGLVLANDNFILNSLDDAIRISETTQQPVLLIFGSESCKFCNKLKEDLTNSELKDYTDRYIICYIDVHDNITLKNKYEVRAIPDTRIIKNKVQITKIVGYNKETYKDKIKNVK